MTAHSATELYDAYYEAEELSKRMHRQEQYRDALKPMVDEYAHIIRGGIWFGVPVSEMTRDELLALAGWAVSNPFGLAAMRRSDRQEADSDD